MQRRRLSASACTAALECMHAWLDWMLDALEHNRICQSFHFGKNFHKKKSFSAKTLWQWQASLCYSGTPHGTARHLDERKPAYRLHAATGKRGDCRSADTIAWVIVREREVRVVRHYNRSPTFTSTRSMTDRSSTFGTLSLSSSTSHW